MGDFAFITDGEVDTKPFLGTVEQIKRVSFGYNGWHSYAVWLKGGKGGKLRYPYESPCPIEVGQEYTFQRWTYRKQVFIKLSKHKI
jgi:hypothetical protein